MAVEYLNGFNDMDLLAIPAFLHAPCLGSGALDSDNKEGSISLEQVARIVFVANVIEARIVTVGDDCRIFQLIL